MDNQNNTQDNSGVLNDVKQPDQVTPDATSRPIVNNQEIGNDPMVTQASADANVASDDMSSISTEPNSPESTSVTPEPVVAGPSASPVSPVDSASVAPEPVSTPSDNQPVTQPMDATGTTPPVATDQPAASAAPQTPVVEHHAKPNASKMRMYLFGVVALVVVVVAVLVLAVHK
jgi:uncharacterized membrane protein